jgi:hypothetical protein
MAKSFPQIFEELYTADPRILINPEQDENKENHIKAYHDQIARKD